MMSFIQSGSETRIYRISSGSKLAGAEPEIFQGRGGFAEFRQFNKNFVKNTRKKRPRRENLGVFSPRYS